MEFVKSEIEHKEPIIVTFFILQHAKLRMIELYYNFLEKYCDDTKFEELENYTDSLYLALSENDLYDCIQPAMQKEWNSLRIGDCMDYFSADSTTKFFPPTWCTKQKILIDENLAYSKKKSAAQKWFVCVAKHIATTILNHTNSILVAQVGLKERLRTVMMVPCPQISQIYGRNW